MRAMVVGTGLQGKATIYDLSRSKVITDIVAVDKRIAGVQQFFKENGCGNVEVVQADVLDNKVLHGLIGQYAPQIMVCMLPAQFSGQIATECVKSGVPFVSTSYAHWISHLDASAMEAGVTLLPEMGLDPGIDLIMGARAVAELDQVEGFYSYGAGIPERAACDNPLNYKISWSFESVLKAYSRPARLLKEGNVIDVGPQDLFDPQYGHDIEIPELGRLETYPNGDAIKYIELFKLGTGLKTMGRFAGRWPGHRAFWGILAKLGLLDEKPVDIDNDFSLAPSRFLDLMLSPQLGFNDGERDIALLRVHVWGLKQEKKKSVIYDLIDYRDLDTGFFAMNRTVGFTASIAAQMILAGQITKAGVLSPINDVDGAVVFEELAQRGIEVIHRVDQ